MAMEEGFSDDSTEIRIPDEDAERMKTVQDAIDYLKEHGIDDE
jgi:acyl carrier protein